MKRQQVQRGIGWAGALLAVLVFTGCASMVDTINKSAEAVERGKAKTGQAMADAVGIGAMQDSVMASLVYAQAFFAGGYAGGYETFEPGEGVVWELTVRDEDGAERMEVERALLKRTEDGNTWWLLRYAAEGEDELISEALLDGQYGLLKFRYRDPETEAIREWVPETEEEAEAEAETEENEAVADEAGQEDYYRGDYSEYVVGTDSVSVPAGRFDAEHVLIEDYYVEEEGEETEEEYRVSYEWWLTEQVPGEIVKYLWRNESEGSSLTGELVDYKKGYSTRLDSY